MAIIRWDPFRDFLALQNEIGRLFERTFGLEERPRLGRWVPAIDMYETDDKLVIKAELPGLKAEDVEIHVDEDSLTIKGERKFSEEVKEENYYRIERRYGAFERVIPLPTKIKTTDVGATFKDGVLEVTLPKIEVARPKRVKVKVQPK
ncbi:MAG: Hsp20/alpha crystallin family protein [Actinomycetota bacterium]